MSTTTPRPADFNFSAGLTPVYPESLRAMAQQVVAFDDPACQTLFSSVLEKLSAAFQAEGEPVLLPGEATLGLEGAAFSLIEPDDVVLNVANGMRGRRFGLWAQRLALEVVDVEGPEDEAIDPDAVKAALDARDDVNVVHIAHAEPAAGLVNPIAAIGELCQAKGVLLMVDAAASFGSAPLTPELTGADVLVAGPRPALGATPGLSLVWASVRAWEKMENNPRAPRDSILSLLDWRYSWNHGAVFPVPPAYPEVAALEAALDLYLTEGPAAVWARHAVIARAVRRGVEALGLRLFVKREEARSDCLTAVVLPDDVAEDDLLEVLRAQYNVQISKGRDSALGPMLRLGHAGPNATPAHALGLIAALAAALNAVGFACPVGLGVEAALWEINNP